MALEPITRKEKIIAGENLEPITRMEQFLKKFGGGGGGLEYDFIIRASLDETGANVLYTLENGTYLSIIAKLGTLPINGKLLLNLGDDSKSDYDPVSVEYSNNKLRVYAVGTDTNNLIPLVYVINPDNTVTAVQ